MNAASCRRISLTASLLICLVAAPVAWAGPPAYLVLRRAESPGKCQQPGRPDAANYDARSSAYAYGYFGVAPRSHASRHFGYYRTYTSWATW